MAITVFNLIMTLSIDDIQHNEHNDIHHNNTKDNDIQNNNTEGL